MPPQGISIGNSVNVPLDLSLTALQLLKKPLYHFSTDIKCRQPPPMTVIGLPYSLLVQVDVSLAMVAPVHFMVDACMRPKLWPSSWPVAVQNVPSLFSQTYLPGLVDVPCAPQPGPQSCSLPQ